MTYLDAEGIRVAYGEFIALRDVDFSVNEGEFVTLLGPSGCGKTTLLNVVAGFVRADAGSMRVGGNDILPLPPEARDSAMCFQSYALFPHLSVTDNIAFGPRQARLHKAETAARVTGLIEKMGLSVHGHKLPNMLSGGQQQRVALARALAVRPGLILFDEPLSNLDAKLRDQVRIEIRSLQRELGFTALYVTHDQAEALAMSDKVLLLNNGVVEQAGTPREVYFQPRTRFVADFIGAANIHELPATAFGTIQSPNDGPLCWRPERAIVGQDAPLRGTITATAFQGAYTDVFVTAGNETVRLQQPGDFSGIVGEALAFGVPADAVIPLEA